MKLQVIYEDETLLVIYKLAGLAVQTARIGETDAVSQLKNYLAGKRDAGDGATEAVRKPSGSKRNAAVKTGGNRCGAAAKAGSPQPPYLGIVHRLDQPVEGLLVFGKTKKAAAELTAQLSRGDLNKAYYAVVAGCPETEEGTLRDFLTKDAGERAARVSETGEAAALQQMPGRQAGEAAALQQMPEGAGGKRSFKGAALHQNREGAREAVLHYRVLEKISTPEPVTLLDIHIETGRFHQIRAQLSHAGLPILGDRKYGTEESNGLSRTLGAQNTALCAYELSFRHPTTGKRMGFAEAPRGEIFSLFASLKGASG